MGIIGLLDRGMSVPTDSFRSNRISNYIGYLCLKFRRNVYVKKTCLISPFSRVNAREGKIEIRDRSTVAPYAIIQGNVSIGENCSVQPFSIIVGYGKDDYDGKITIGNNVRIASHVMIIGANHIYENPDKPIAQQGLKCKSIKIEDDVWIGGNVNIIAGVTIGKGSVIAAGAVVTKDVKPYSVVAGVPGRVIKTRKRSEEE